MAKDIIWRGREAQAFELLQALNRHCSCVTTPRGGLKAMCPGHQMLVDDERAINGFLFARHIASRLQAEEFALPQHVQALPTTDCKVDRGPQRHFNAV